MTDASDVAVGAVLQQCVNGEWCLSSYFSRTLKPAETRYSMFDRELLTVYLAIKHFRYFVDGRVFHIFTDHKPLTYTHSDHDKPVLISQFTSDIRHVKGPADTLLPWCLCTVRDHIPHSRFLFHGRCNSRRPRYFPSVLFPLTNLPQVGSYAHRHD